MRQWIQALFYLGIFSFSTAGYAQTGLRKLSGTVFTEEQKNFIRSHYPKMEQLDDSTARGVHEIPVKVHIARKSDGSGAISVAEVLTAFKHLNAQLLPIYVRLVPLNDYNYINDDKFHNFNKSVEEELCKADAEKILNLYLVGSIKDAKNDYCGYTYPPSNKPKDRIFMSHKCLVDKVSFTRQVGHYLSLFPTHGTDETKNTDEFVDAKNCKTAGDEICDTPADPRLVSQFVDPRCGYIGEVQDGHSRFFRPLLDNYMSDNPRLTCVDKFTRQQYRRMLYTVLNIRNYLQFPKSSFSKKQQKMMEDEYGIQGEVLMELNGFPLPAKLDKNFYKGTNTCSANNSYRISITNHRKAYIYIIEGDSLRGANLVYPKQGDKLFFEDKKTTFVLPSTSDVFTVDNKHKGTNQICVLFSKKQLPVADMLKKINAGSPKQNFMQRIYDLYGEQIINQNDLQYESSKMSVSGLTSERTIAPIFIEYTQQ